jgi:hypothetical protein
MGFVPRRLSRSDPEPVKYKGPLQTGQGEKWTIPGRNIKGRELQLHRNNPETMNRTLSARRSRHPALRFFITIGLWLVIPNCTASAEEIQDAVEAGNIGKIRALLQDNPGLVLRKDGRDRTPLHDALLNETRDVLQKR